MAPTEEVYAKLADVVIKSPPVTFDLESTIKILQNAQTMKILKEAGRMLQFYEYILPLEVKLCPLVCFLSESVSRENL